MGHRRWQERGHPVRPRAARRSSIGDSCANLCGLRPLADTDNLTYAINTPYGNSIAAGLQINPAEPSVAKAGNVILVTGNHNPPPEILGQADAFVVKAYSLNALTDSVRDVLLRRKLRRIG